MGRGRDPRFPADTVEDPLAVNYLAQVVLVATELTLVYLDDLSVAPDYTLPIKSPGNHYVPSGTWPVGETHCVHSQLVHCRVVTNHKIWLTSVCYIIPRLSV